MRSFEITCPLGKELRTDDVRMAAANALRLRRNAVINVVDPTKSYQPTMVNADAHCHIVHRSIDARGDVRMRYRIEAYYKDEPYEEYKVDDYKDVTSAPTVIVVGSGPAGMFAGLKLLTLGLKPVILERGKDVHKRKFDIAKMSRDGVINPDSNYCYGEGGAGTFSDGKLFTRSSKRGDIREVLHQFVNFGADPSILIDAHPHIGTDKLPKIVENIRKCIIEHGGEYHFDSKVVDVTRLKSGILNVKVEDTSGAKTSKITYKADAVILATGHSARDIYNMFSDKGWDLQAKGFALGVRVEHPQSLMNKIRYHGQWEEGMPAAEYSFVEQMTMEGPAVKQNNTPAPTPDTEVKAETAEAANASESTENAECNEEAEAKNNARGVFSFCMCPGGILVPSSTEDKTIVLNGMSNSARNSKWSNAGVVVQIEPEDAPEKYKNDGAFALLNLQHDIEKKMYDYTDSVRKRIEQENAEDPENTRPLPNPLAAPAQRMIDFCNEVVSHELPETSYKPGVVPAPLHELLPDFVAKRLQYAFPEINKHGMRGYFTNDSLLLGVESRTSSPVRIPRDPDTYCCLQVPGLFPAGEGSGYSGGIVSSAIDGINCAVAAMHYLSGSSDTPSEEISTDTPTGQSEISNTIADSHDQEAN